MPAECDRVVFVLFVALIWRLLDSVWSLDSESFVNEISRRASPSHWHFVHQMKSIFAFQRLNCGFLPRVPLYMFLNIFNCLLIGDSHVRHQEFQSSRFKSEFKIFHCLINILMGENVAEEKQVLFPSKIIFRFSALQGNNRVGFLSWLF